MSLRTSRKYLLMQQRSSLTESTLEWSIRRSMRMNRQPYTQELLHVEQAMMMYCSMTQVLILTDETGWLYARLRWILVVRNLSIKWKQKRIFCGQLHTSYILKTQIRVLNLAMTALKSWVNCRKIINLSQRMM